MDKREMSAEQNRDARIPASERARFGFLTMLLSLLVFVTGSAHAEPNVANYYLQQSKNNFTVAKLNYQQGRVYAINCNPLSSCTSLARSYFITASQYSAIMASNANNLYIQNVQTLGTRRCRNLSAQQAAVSHSSVLRQQIATLSANFSILIQQPTSLGSLTYTDMTINQITVTLINIEQSMISAQCY